MTSENTADRMFVYRLLTLADRSALRMERVHGLEADLYRVELALEDAVDTAEREMLARRAELLGQRLRVHLPALAGAVPEGGSVPDAVETTSGAAADCLHAPE